MLPAAAIAGSGAAIPPTDDALLAKIAAGKQVPAGQQSRVCECTIRAIGDRRRQCQSHQREVRGATSRMQIFTSVFKVKYVAEGAAYLNGGSSSGLAQGHEAGGARYRSVRADSATPQGPVVAELQIVSVAETSAVTEIHNPKRDVKPGDWADLSAADYRRGLESNRP